ncbi:hypothetical protein BDV33DRAFT_232948 [Aspergillus novoparasiticus]|uniref:Uncharacterized protein n=1 Tax=Aspergillus novoparasiticus TaxID=986946 RepID=A0A5N6EJK1_9EURO|nr:hypothetical protein BDV33DRAFT_232948 [Aspergillus novoparasiticus]
MEEKQHYLGSKAAKYALGIHRGPLPQDDGEGVAIEHVETANTISLEKREKTRAERARRHWARFWCCYIFWSLIFLAVFLPVFFTVIIPAIAQRVVDNSSLVLTETSVMQPRPDSIMLSLKTALKLPIGVPVRIEPIAISLFNRKAKGNGTWAKVYLDGATIDGNTTLGVDNQFTPLNVEQWKEYVHSVVFEKNAPLSLNGKTTAYLGKLKNHITMDKDIKQNSMFNDPFPKNILTTVPALNSFAGFSVEDPQLLLPPREDGTNLIANATLPNPSVMTLEIGTTVLDLKSGDLVIGNATIDNLVLKPGNHSSPIHGIMDLKVLLKNLVPILQTQASSLKNGYLTLDTVGKSVVYDGVEVPYYTEVMRNLTMTAQVPLGGLITNTLRGILHGGNGTNIFANLTDNSNSDSGGSGGGLLDLLGRSDEGLANMLTSRAVDELLNNPEKRSSIINVLEGFL